MPPKRRTSTPHITNLGRRTRSIRTVRAPNRTLALKRIESLHKGPILLHCNSDGMPERSIQRRILGPTDGISITGRVFELVGRSALARVEGGEGIDVCVPGIGVVDVEGSGVDFVEAEAAVEVCERRDARADPTGCQRVCGGLHSAILGVINHDFVFVGVAEEDARNDVG